MANKEDGYHAAINAEQLFSQVTSIEEELAEPAAIVDGVDYSLNLYGLCMEIMFRSVSVELTDQQRTELNDRMERVNAELHQRAMRALWS